MIVTEHQRKRNAFFMRCCTNGICPKAIKSHVRFVIDRLAKIRCDVIYDCTQTNAYSNVTTVSSRSHENII